MSTAPLAHDVLEQLHSFSATLGAEISAVDQHRNERIERAYRLMGFSAAEIQVRQDLLTENTAAIAEAANALADTLLYMRTQFGEAAYESAVMSEPVTTAIASLRTAFAAAEAEGARLRSIRDQVRGWIERRAPHILNSTQRAT